LEQLALAAVFAEPPVTLVWHGWVAREIREDLSGFFVFGGRMLGAGTISPPARLAMEEEICFCNTRFGANAVG